MIYCPTLSEVKGFDEKENAVTVSLRILSS
jgi:hypothetical protein